MKTFRHEREHGLPDEVVHGRRARRLPHQFDAQVVHRAGWQLADFRRQNSVGGQILRLQRPPVFDPDGGEQVKQARVLPIIARPADAMAKLVNHLVERRVGNFVESGDKQIHRRRALYDESGQRGEHGATVRPMKSWPASFFHSCAVGLVALGALLLGGCEKHNSNALVSGMELSYPPFEMTDVNNQPTGVGVDLARALAAYLHKELVIRNTQFTGLIPALKTGKIDIIISSMTVTEERARSIDFSDPYISTGICLLVNANSDIQSIADVDKPGRKVVVRTGTTGAFYARDHFKYAQILPIAEEAACVLEVSQGKADCFIYDQLSDLSIQPAEPKDDTRDPRRVSTRELGHRDSQRQRRVAQADQRLPRRL